VERAVRDKKKTWVKKMQNKNSIMKKKKICRNE